MADKKRKIFMAKESNTPRRPVILKSDREATKEQVKEKQEKEKQPTILLKTREQSTPKEERPLSPKLLKVQTTEHEGPQPCKIAQNENKDKKVAEPKPLHPLKTMTQPVKLLDENLEFCQSALEFLQDSSTSYLVVGVIGTQGVGKSLILNLIANNSSTLNLSSHLLKSNELNERFDVEYQGGVDTELEKLNIVDTPEVKTQEDSSNNCFKFKMQEMEQIEKGVHCTKGIDMYVTNDRVILLDCQALWSPSLIEETNLNPITFRSANLMTVDCLQIASFLMAVCHVVIAVQDWFANYNFIRYIQTAEMLMPSLSASSSSTSAESSESTNTGENHPHLLLLHNRCQLEDFTPETVKIMQDFYRKAFQKSNLQLTSGMYMYTDSNKNGVGVDGSRRQYNVERCGAPINMFLLPEINDDQQETYQGHPPLEECGRRLRWLVLGVCRHHLTNVANLSERGWFAFCAKAWETIRKSTFYMEYERFLP